MKATYNQLSSLDEKIDIDSNNENFFELHYNDIDSANVSFKHRQQGSKLIQAIKQNRVDYVTVKSVDLLGRNLMDILQTLIFFNKHKIKLKIENLGLISIIDNSLNPTYNLILSVMTDIAIMERNSLKESQLKGIAIAKEKGIYKGRVKGSYEPTDVLLSKYPEVIESIKSGNSLRKTAKLSGVSLGTVQKVKRYLNAS